MEIPRLGLSTVIREGIESQTLLLAVGHLPGTPLPGQKGNVVKGGHRDTFFRRPRPIRPDHSIRIVTQTGVFRYRVESTRVVPQNAPAVLETTREPAPTLVTCYPFVRIGPAPKRFIVRARMIEPVGPPAA